jgi:hypothetical protein
MPEMIDGVERDQRKNRAPVFTVSLLSQRSRPRRRAGMGVWRQSIRWQTRRLARERALDLPGRTARPSHFMPQVATFPSRTGTPVAGE